jgi:hypothetical protein
MKKLLSLLIFLAVLLASLKSSAQSKVPRFVSTQGSLSTHWPFYSAITVPMIGSPGTTQTTWSVGGTLGPLINDNAGVLEARNAANSSYIVFRTADPVLSNDVVNLHYLNTTGVATGGDLSGNSSNATVVGIRGSTVPALTNGCLTSTAGILTWGTCGGGGSSVSGTGLWYSSSGTLNGAAVGLSGDATLGTLTGGNVPITLATVNGNVGTFGSSSVIPSVTTNAKGLITAVTTNTVAAPLGSATGTLTVSHGGTGLTTLAANGVLIGEGTSVPNSVVLGNAQLLVGQTAADPQAKTLGGDATLSNTAALTLNTVNSNTGSFGTTSTIPVITVNGKGLTTAISTVTVAAPLGSATGTLAVTQLGHGTDAQVLQTNGTTPTWNTFSQDVTVNDTGVTTVNSIHGTSPIAITPNNLQWIQTASGPQWSQVQQANGSAPVNWKWSPQAPGSGASTTSNGTPGSAIVDLASPVSTGNEARLQINRNGSRIGAIGQQNGAGSFLYAGPNDNNAYIVQSSSLQLEVAGAIGLMVDGNLNTTIGQNATVGGGVGTGNLLLGNSSGVPTSAATSGVAIYSNAGNLEINTPTLQFPKFQANPTITQVTASSGNGTLLSIIAQQGAPSGSTNGGAAFLAGGPAGSGGFGKPGDGAIGTGDFAATISAHEIAPGVGEARAQVDGATSDIAPDGQGTINTQAATSFKHRYFCRTTTTTQVQCGTFSLPTSDTHAIVRVRLLMRDVTSHSNTSDYVYEALCSAVNVGGTVTAINGSTTQYCGGTGASSSAIQQVAGTSNPGPVFDEVTSGTNVDFFVAPNTGTHTFDWTIDVDGLIN